MIDVDVSLKNAVTYNDRPHEDIIEGVRCYEKSSVGIYPNTFTLKLQDYYLYLINNFLEVSKNYEKRNMERNRYFIIKNKFISKINIYKSIIKDRKTHKYFKCKKNAKLLEYQGFLT